MKKQLLFVLAATSALTGLVGCGEEEAAEKFEIAIVTDVGQLNDGGFNQGTYEGAQAYAKAHELTYKYYQPANGSDATDNDRIAAMTLAIENGAKVIVTPGFLQQPAIAAVAEKNPDVKFVFVDGWNFGMANVTAISYKEHESGYFAGYAAVKDGYTKLGGTFGGGATNAACNRFSYGYVQGIEAAAAELEKTVDVKISFQYGDAFSSSPELQTQISGWYATGTEVVFSCGGSMLQSVKAAAGEYKNAKIIGVDVDQHAESDKVLTSAVKGLSASVQKVLGELYGGKWESNLSDKTSNLGASDNATGLPTSDEAWRFTSFTKTEYKALFDKVAAGTIVIRSDTQANMNSNAAWSSLVGTCSHINFTLEGATD